MIFGNTTFDHVTEVPNLSPSFTWNYFKQKDSPHELRDTQLLELRKCRRKTYGLNTTSKQAAYAK